MFVAEVQQQVYFLAFKTFSTQDPGGAGADVGPQPRDLWQTINTLECWPDVQLDGQKIESFFWISQRVLHFFLRFKILLLLQNIIQIINGVAN